MSLAPVGTIKKDLDESQLQELLMEIVVGAIRGTNLHLNLSGYTNCPRLWREPVNQPGYSLPIHYDSMVSIYNVAYACVALVPYAQARNCCFSAQPRGKLNTMIYSS